MPKISKYKQDERAFKGMTDQAKASMNESYKQISRNKVERLLIDRLSKLEDDGVISYDIYKEITHSQPSEQTDESIKKYEKI